VGWRDESPCKGAWNVFFEGVFPDDESPTTIDLDGYARARGICETCGVRRECGLAVMTDEAERPLEDRDGVFAGMTPGQRYSLERRGTIRCDCGHVRDPLQLIDGVLACEACGTTESVPVVPLMGDRWAKRHTTLARKLVGWLIENIEDEAKLPQPSGMVEILGSSVHDVVRVYEGLVADGTLRCRTDEGQHPTYYRNGALRAAERWHDPFTNQ
jgi:hypothetical protein